MYSFFGTGIKLYGTPAWLLGKSQAQQDGSYPATKWITILFFPVIPLKSYRVWRGEDEVDRVGAFSGLYISVATMFQVVEVPLNIKQIFMTWLYGLLLPPAVIIAILLIGVIPNLIVWLYSGRNPFS